MFFFRRYFLIAIAVTLVTRAVASPVPEAAKPPSRFRVGLAAQLIYPNEFPEFKTSLATYGLVGAVRVWDHAIQVQGSFGKADDLSLYFLEANFRYNIETPFINFYLLAGAHYLRYDRAYSDHWRGGINTGPGLRLTLGTNLEGTVGMKLYFQDRLIVSFGGGLMVLL